MSFDQTIRTHNFKTNKKRIGLKENMSPKERAEQEYLHSLENFMLSDLDIHHEKKESIRALCLKSNVKIPAYFENYEGKDTDWVNIHASFSKNNKANKEERKFSTEIHENSKEDCEDIAEIKINEEEGIFESKQSSNSTETVKYISEPGTGQKYIVFPNTNYKKYSSIPYQPIALKTLSRANQHLNYLKTLKFQKLSL